MAATIDKILNLPDLLDILVAEVHKSVAGETDTIKTILIPVIGGCKVIDAEPSSFNILINAPSGSGKDKLMTHCLELLPENIVEQCKSMSPKVFRYWHTAYRPNSKGDWQGDPDWSWNGKIFYGEDLSDRVINDNIFKVMVSSKIPNAYIVDKGKVIQIRVRGKPIVVVTTANANLCNENLRRFMVCGLDTTENQTKRIVRKWSQIESKGRDSIFPSTSVKTAIELLKRVRVRIPFVRTIGRHFPTSNIISRTVYPRLLDLIKASAALYQYQREEVAENTIKATWEDYDNACLVFHKTTTNDKMIPLTGSKKDLLEIMQETNGDVRGIWFTAKILRELSGLGYDALLYHLRSLVQNGFLKVTTDNNTNVGRPCEMWQPVTVNKLHLLTSKELRK